MVVFIFQPEPNSFVVSQKIMLAFFKVTYEGNEYGYYIERRVFLNFLLNTFVVYQY